MKFSSSVLAATLACCFSVSAYADATVRNNTDTVATAYVSGSCSSMAGDEGIMKPHSSVVVPQWVLGFFCGFGCDAQVYMSNNCSGPKIATIHADSISGITNVNNHNVKGFRVTGSGFSASIEQDAPKGWFEKLMSWV